ncbi:hypothetical protein K1719_032769 [Acacia pycnantha]|nr:hypothetical protein K1719_032769 [Acacia pycnantha]
MYTVVEDQLYRKGLYSPMLKCLSSEEAKYILAEIHEGINGQYMGAKALARKALRVGFKILAEVVTDNETQFIDKGFQEMMFGFQIKHHFASVEHPQSNGQEEVANKVIIDGLRKWMEDTNSSWVEQLYFVLWGYKTSAPTSTGETPFRMKTLQEDEEKNNEAVAMELDLIDEVRVMAHCQDMAAKQLIADKYNKKVKPRSFEKGDLVLRRADVGNKNAKDRKLAAN